MVLRILATIRFLMLLWPLCWWCRLLFSSSLKPCLGRSKLGACSKAKGEERRSPPRKRESLALHSLLLFGVLYVASLPHAGVVVLSLAHDWYSTVLPELWTTEHYREALGHPLVVPSIQNSLFYASAATLVDLILGVAIAWVIVRSTIRGRAFLDALVMLPLAVPGLVLAFGYLALSQKGESFYFLVQGAAQNPTWLLVVAYAVRRLPYVVRSAVAGLQQSNLALEEAARSLGATPARTLRRVSLPLLGANLIAGGILAFAFAMLEVSDSLILGPAVRAFPDHEGDLLASGNAWEWLRVGVCTWCLGDGFPWDFDHWSCYSWGKEGWLVSNVGS